MLILADLIDQNHGIAHDHAHQGNHAGGRHKAKRRTTDQQADGDADHAQRRHGNHHEAAADAVELHHQQGKDHHDHEREACRDGLFSFGGFLDRAAHFDAETRWQLGANGIELRVDGR